MPAVDAVGRRFGAAIRIFQASSGRASASSVQLPTEAVTGSEQVSELLERSIGIFHLPACVTPFKAYATEHKPPANLRRDS